MVTSPESRSRRPWAAAGVVTAVVAAAAIAAYYYLRTLTVIPGEYRQWVDAGLIAIFGILAIVLVGRILRLEATHRLGAERAFQVLDVYRLIAYVALAFALLASLGVNGVDLLAGGTFAGLVIGLAAQTTLGNLFAGVLLLVARPFSEGDRITLATWQFGFLGPSYPPKFYSDDLLVLGFTGTVHSIGLSYSAIRRDDGTLVRFPNNIVIQAAVLSHEVGERWVRTKYDIPSDVDPTILLPKVRERLGKNKWVARPETVRVTIGAATPTSYVLVLDALCRGSYEEPPRSDFLIELMGLVRELRGEPAASSPRSAGGSSPAPH
jgi:small conductance mechanosensitive channel